MNFFTLSHFQKTYPPLRPSLRSFLTFVLNVHFFGVGFFLFLFFFFVNYVPFDKHDVVTVPPLPRPAPFASRRNFSTRNRPLFLPLSIEFSSSSIHILLRAKPLSLREEQTIPSFAPSTPPFQTLPPTPQPSFHDSRFEARSNNGVSSSRILIVFQKFWNFFFG